MTLLLINFILAFAVCFIVARIFRAPINKILQRLVSEEIYIAWPGILSLQPMWVGIRGRQDLDLERYITPPTQGGAILELTQERWVLECTVRSSEHSKALPGCSCCSSSSRLSPMSSSRDWSCASNIPESVLFPREWVRHSVEAPYQRASNAIDMNSPLHTAIDARARTGRFTTCPRFHSVFHEKSETL